MKIKPDGSKTIYVAGLYEVNKNAAGTVTGTTTYYPAGEAMRVNGTLYFVLKDKLGSASVVTDASGNTVGEARYYPYGETRLTTGTMNTDKLFTGQREITGLGIYHYGSRFYSPKLGRFLSADSIVPNPANPQAFNRYSYVFNNPFRYVDPSGNIPIDCWGTSYCGSANSDLLPERYLPPRSSSNSGNSAPRVFYLNGLGGGENIPPVYSDESEYSTVMYYLSEAVGEENVTHVPVFTDPYVQGPSQLDMFGEALGIDANWTESALDMITTELTNNPLENGQELVIVGSSAGGTVAIELLDDLQREGIFVDQVILRGSPVMELTLTNVGRVDYITAEIPISDWKYYSIDINPFDAVIVQEHQVPGLVGHDPTGQGVMSQIGTLIVDLIMGDP